MSALKIRAGTPEHREALYRAACDYQNGLSIEASARKHRVQPMTLRNYLQRAGWIIHTHRHYPGRVRTNHIPDALLNEHPRLTPRQIADACGVSITIVRERLRARGNYQPRSVGQQPTTAWANSLRNRDKVLRAVELRERGLTQGEIAIRLGANRSTVNTWLRQYKAGTFLWQREPIPSWLRDDA